MNVWNETFFNIYIYIYIINMQPLFMDKQWLFLLRSHIYLKEKPHLYTTSFTYIWRRSHIFIQLLLMQLLVVSWNSFFLNLLTPLGPHYTNLIVRVCKSMLHICVRSTNSFINNKIQYFSNSLFQLHLIIAPKSA